MDYFIPDVYQKSIYTINYQNLKKSGIKCLLFDLNNTMASKYVTVPDQSLKDLFAYLESMQFKLIILSNASKARVEPFKEKLNVDSAFKSRKPRKDKYQKILNLYHLKVHEVASIGDCLFTDIYGANLMGFTSILVNPISNVLEDSSFLIRFIENFLYKKMRKKGILEKGVYYE